MERLSNLTRTIAALPKGTAFTRYAMALATGDGDPTKAAAIARTWAHTTPAVAAILQKSIDVGTTLDPQWASSLVDYQALSGEFVELVRNRSILGRLTGWRRVPFATRTLATADAASAAWAGQARPIPTSSMSFESLALAFYKVSALVVVTAELLRGIDPVSEAAVRDELVRTVAEFVDRALVDPALAEVAGESPASLTNGVVPLHSSGPSVENITGDLAALAGSLVTAGSTLANAGWIVHPRSAIYLSTLRDSAGALAFPTVTAIGGTLLGLPVIPTAAVPLVGSPSDASIVLIDPTRVLLADDDLATIDTSRNAALQLVDDPATGAQNLVSLWQFNLTGVRVIRFVNWKRTGPSSVAVLDRVAF